MMADRKKPNKPIWLLLFIPPLFFIVKDFIATQVVLSYEPGITAEAVHNYAVQLLPGSLFVVTGHAPVLNLAFGIFIGAALFLIALYRRRRRYRVAAEQIVGRERRERVSHHDLSGDA
jgi:hypothetical protein